MFRHLSQLTTTFPKNLTNELHSYFRLVPLLPEVAPLIKKTEKRLSQMVIASERLRGYSGVF